MAYKVGLLDADSAYQRALMEYLNLRATVPIQLYAFTNPEAFDTFLKKEMPELILVGDEYADRMEQENCQGLVLTKKRENIGRSQYLFRYQSVDTLIKYMLETIGTAQKTSLEKGVFLAVYSPLGRCGKTQFANSLCRAMPDSLYVNWEGISAEEATDGIGSYLLYCMKSRNEACFAYLQEQHVTRIPPPDSFQDIRQAELQDMFFFRDGIRKRNLYDGVVFDIGVTALSGYEILSAFDSIFVPTLEDEPSQMKQKWFERAYLQEGGDIEKLRYISLDGQDSDRLAKQYVR